MRIRILALPLVISLAACPTVGAQTTLKDAFPRSIRVGAALGAGVFTESDAQGAALVKQQFNTVTPENVLKWEVVHPADGRYNWEPGDKYVAFGEKNGMFVIGHCLVWHSQTPKWVFEDGQGHPATREQLLARMKDHIQTVVGRYKGRIKGWDVVNEALADDGTLRQSPWFKIIGEEYIAKAFEYAHEADPAAQLYYNDYSLEQESKTKGMVAMITKLKAGGAPIYGVGTQGHYRIDWPAPDRVAATIEAIAGLGLKAMITELDMDVLPSAWEKHTADVNATAEAKAQEFERLNPYPNGLPSDVEQRLTERWVDLTKVFVSHAKTLERVTFWGVTDRTSWLNNWPIRGRRSYPLLFDRTGQPRPAFAAVIAAAQAK